ncbi:MAG: SWIM zinc finger domain-containing protein [Deltaproteobacteria bacterium]|nr:SWIM zinc finger domain-containing protein [Deltaproteobacteria bacterium]
MVAITEIQRKIKKLDWSDIREWAGSKIMARGESYFEDGYVSKLRISTKGLIAKVDGSSPYLTLVSFDKKDQLKSECTCPYGYDCKHGVATLLAYCDSIKSKKKVPTTNASDPDITKVLTGEDSDDFEDDDEYYEPEAVRAKGKRGKSESTDSDINSFLAKKTKAVLQELIVSYTKEYPEIKKQLLDEAKVSTGKVKSLVTAMRKEIAQITSTPAWQNHWDGRGELADFGRVKSVMEQLLLKRQYQAVIDINRELVAQANSYIETCDDDGDAGCQISECIEIGFDALSKSDLPDFEKLSYSVMTSLEDEYDLFNASSIVIESIDDKEVWSQLADDLYKKIPKRIKGEVDFSLNYRRDRLTNALINALEQSDRQDEVLDLCKKEAKITGSWERYVSRLFEKKMYSEAKLAALEGIDKVGSKYAGTAKSLREWIIKIADKDKDFETILKIRMEGFLDQPSLSTYNKLLTASKKVKAVEEVKIWTLQYLETGAIKKAPIVKLDASIKKPRHASFPQINILIDIAEQDKDPDRVLHWYNHSKKLKSNSFWYQDDVDRQVARSISKKHPEESIKIWKSLAEEQVALTKSSAYDIAVGYLSQVKKLSHSLGKKAEWNKYLTNIAEKNKRKPRFIKSLRRLQPDKLI